MTFLAAALSMLLLGDSITEGRCHEADTDPTYTCTGWVEHFQATCGPRRLTPRNIARPGFAAWMWANPLQRDRYALPPLAQRRYRHALLMIGTNDFAGTLRGGDPTPETVYEDAMSSLLAWLRVTGRVRHFWLVAPPPHERPDWQATRKRYLIILKRLARTYRRTTYLDPADVLEPGPTHPTDADHRVLGEWIGREVCR